MRFRVTPGAVAPPLLAPSFHGFTQIGPPPTLVELNRPYTPYCSPVWHFGFCSAAAVPMPDSGVGFAAPGGGCTACAAGVATVAYKMPIESATVPVRVHLRLDRVIRIPQLPPARYQCAVTLTSECEGARRA